MNKLFDIVKRDLPKMAFSDSLVSFIVFGSSVVNANQDRKPGDCDICVVVRNRDVDLEKIANFIFAHFADPDYRIYFLDEILGDLPFMDYGVGVFSVEYFAHGRSLFGENIFKKILCDIDQVKLKESYLNKISEYIIRIRRAYISPTYSREYKMWHTYKYVLRLMIDTLLYFGYISYGQMIYMNREDILGICIEKGIVKSNQDVDFNDCASLYLLFQEVNLFLANTKFKSAYMASKDKISIAS